MDEYSWLVERARTNAPPEYLTVTEDGTLEFVNDPWAALRLSRKEDGEAILRLFPGVPDLRVAEHAWMN